MTLRLDGFSTTELHAELERRELVARIARAEKQNTHVRDLLEHVEALLSLVPEHGRTSCSDTHRGNAGQGCVRCALLELRETRDFPFFLRFEIEPFNEERDQ